MPEGLYEVFHYQAGYSLSNAHIVLITIGENRMNLKLFNRNQTSTHRFIDIDSYGLKCLRKLEDVVSWLFVIINSSRIFGFLRVPSNFDQHFSYSVVDVYVQIKLLIG